MSNCSLIALDIHTYYAGKNQLTHPNVVSFEKPWHGYRYYMTYTAYPYANGSEENPCIAASNDLLHWEKPDGLINPIACCEETECDELKDTHLLYREDLDRLEIWYLGRIRGTWKDRSPLYCFRKVSQDGIHWDKYEVMFRFEGMNLASQTVLFEDGQYHFWGVQNTTEHIALHYMNSSDGISWSAFEKCDVPDAERTNMWHGALTRYKDKLYFVWVGNREKNQDIYVATSSDRKHFSSASVIIHNDAGWDFLYRPALIIDNGQFYCFYGVVRCDGKWMVALSKGESIECLTGTSFDEVGYSIDRTAGNTKLRLKVAVKKLMSVFVPRLSVGIIPLMIIALESTWLSWLAGVLMCMTLFYLKFDRKHFIQGGLINGTIYSAAGVFLAQLFLEMLCVLF